MARTALMRPRLTWMSPGLKHLCLVCWEAFLMGIWIALLEVISWFVLP